LHKQKLFAFKALNFKRKHFTNKKHGAIIAVSFWKRERTPMIKSLITSAYFFFFSFTYFYVGKAYLGFTEKKSIARGA